MTLEEIFGPTGDVTWAQECARAMVIFVYGWVLVRVAGRRVFGQWTALDVIVAIVTGSTLSRALTGNANLFGTLAATTLLMASHWVLTRVCARWPAASRVLEGKPVTLAKDGQVLADVLERHGVSRAMLEEALRHSGAGDAAATSRVLLEPSGKISVKRVP